MHIFSKENRTNASKRKTKHILYYVIAILSCITTLSLSCCAILFWNSFSAKNESPIQEIYPVRPFEEDEIISLPGLSYKPKFKHYSGYLLADGNYKKFIHYWFAESQSNSSERDPIVLWLNGGPGCSSLFGVFNEIGPYRLHNQTNGYGDNVLIENQYAWNKQANLLFFESPAQVGWSYDSYDKSNHTVDDRETAIQNFNALSHFMKIKFPHYRDNPLYLTGESYGGIYLPMLADIIDTDGTMNLKGIAIGNGYFHTRLQVNSRVLTKYLHNLYIGESSYLEEQIRKCCDIEDADIDRRCRNLPEKCPDLMLDDVYKHDQSVDYYNIKRRCNPVGRDSIESHFKSRTGMKNMLKLDKTNNDYRLRNPLFSIGCDLDSMRLLINYLNRVDVINAINIPYSIRKMIVKFDICNGKLPYDLYIRNYADNENGIAQIFHHLMINRQERRYKFVLYNGDQDSVCTHMGIEWFLEHTNISATSDYSEWRVGERVAGLIKQYEYGLTLMTVRDAGHLVGHDKPAEAAHVLHKYLLDIIEQ